MLDNIKALTYIYGETYKEEIVRSMREKAEEIKAECDEYG